MNNTSYIKRENGLYVASNTMADCRNGAWCVINRETLKVEVAGLLTEKKAQRLANRMNNKAYA